MQAAGTLTGWPQPEGTKPGLEGPEPGLEGPEEEGCSREGRSRG
jgi:hypothetical protein